MKRFSIALALVASLAIASTAMAAPTKLRAQSGGGGVATILSNTSARLEVTALNDYALVYTPSTSSKVLADVDMGFVLESGSAITGGSPRITIPIDTDGNGKWDDFASIDANACGVTYDANNLTVADLLVSTTSPNCVVSLNYGSGAGTYANWDALIADQPTWRIAKGQQSFIIADYPVTDALLTSIDLN